MEVKAILRFARISPTKARDLIKLIRGLPVSDALRAVQFSHRKGALLITKTLKSAIANAENNAKLAAESLFVKEALVLDGPAMKRFRPRARGSASPILKRMSHVRIVLSDARPGEKKASARKETEASGTEG
jgi:large subunit ribosomal protein L22